MKSKNKARRRLRRRCWVTSGVGKGCVKRENIFFDTKKMMYIIRVILTSKLIRRRKKGRM